MWKTLDWRHSAEEQLSRWWDQLGDKAIDKYNKVERAVGAICRGAGPDPEGAADILDLGLDHLPNPGDKIELVPTDLAQELLKQGREHARDEANFGTINKTAQQRYRELGLYP